MLHVEIVKITADILKDLDSERPIHKTFKPGIGPFGEPQIVREIARRLTGYGIRAQTKRTPDLEIAQEWALEFKIVRPFGDNGREAENWSVNLLHPYQGNVSLIGDAIKLAALNGYRHRSLSHRPVGGLSNTGVGAMRLNRGWPVQLHRPLVGPQKGRLLS